MLARLADEAQLQVIEEATKTLKSPDESPDLKGKSRNQIRPLQGCFDKPDRHAA
jgi:hypothetical protein